VVHSANHGTLRDAVDGLTGYDHAVRRSTAAPRSSAGLVNGLRFDEISLVFVAYANRVSVLAPPTRDQVLLTIPLGPMHVETAGRRTTMTAPFALSSSVETTMYPDPDAGALVASVQVSAITEVLSESFGGRSTFSLDLAQARPIPLNASIGLRRTWTDFAWRPDPAGVGDLIDSLLVSLVPYTNYRASERAEWLQPPAYLMAAVRYLRRHHAEPVSLTSLSEAIGIGARQLQIAFKAHLGCTAQEYLKGLRLEHAWMLLGRAASGAAAERTVASVGAEVGIPHQGRFAQYFVERFGVLPSALLG
jgi:AraC-like DNA-binding protein